MIEKRGTWLLIPQNSSRVDFHKWKVFFPLQNSNKWGVYYFNNLESHNCFPSSRKTKDKLFPDFVQVVGIQLVLFESEKAENLTAKTVTQLGLKSQHNNYKCLQEGEDVPGGEDAILWVQAGGIRLGFLPGNIIHRHLSGHLCHSAAGFGESLWQDVPSTPPDSWCTWITQQTDAQQGVISGAKRERPSTKNKHLCLESKMQKEIKLKYH